MARPDHRRVGRSLRAGCGRPARRVDAGGQPARDDRRLLRRAAPVERPRPLERPGRPATAAPGDPYAVFHGEGADFRGWYVNFQEPFRRTALGFDTMDNVLDIVIAPHGSWRWKDEEELELLRARGRFTQAEVDAIRADGIRVAAELDAGRRWWSDEWAVWEPDLSWPVPELPPGWEETP